MELPKRTPEHIAETKSWKIMNSTLPHHWLVRELSERDYGIDAYIELVKSQGEVTGELCSIQLKSSKSVSWKNDCASFSVRIATANYWWNLPVPVFVVWVDLTEERAFFTPAKIQLRVRHNAFLTQKSFSFMFHNDHELGTETGNIHFLVQHIREKHYADFHHLLRGLMLHWEQYLEFIQHNQGLDHFLGVEVEDEIMLHHIFESCKFLAKNIGADWNLPSLQAIYRKDKEAFGESHDRLHNQSLDYILKAIEPAFLDVLKKSREHILGPEIEYWYHVDPVLYQHCILMQHRLPKETDQ